MGPEGTLAPDWDDEIVTGMCVLRDGQPMAPAAVELLGGAASGAHGDRSAVTRLAHLGTPSTGHDRASSST